MYISQVHTNKHTHTISLSRSLILKIIQTPRQMELHHFHKSYLYLLIHYLQSSSNHSLLNNLDKTDASQEHTYTLFTIHSLKYTHDNTEDKTDATADGDASCLSVRYTHIYTLSLLLKKTLTPRQMEIHHVHQSGTHTHTLFLSP